MGIFKNLFGRSDSKTKSRKEVKQELFENMQRGSKTVNSDGETVERSDYSRGYSAGLLKAIQENDKKYAYSRKRANGEKWLSRDEYSAQYSGDKSSKEKKSK